MKPETDNGLTWEAFRYVAGEMSRDECAGFERLLAENQSAREAVAEAVEVTQAVKLSLASEPVVPSQSHPSSRAGSWWLGVAMGSAACLLVMLGWQQVGTPEREVSNGEPTTETPDAVNRDAGALAERWSEVVQRDDNPWGDESSDDQFAESLSDWDVGAASDEDAHAAPEWMMAAVSAAKKREGMMDDMDMERSVDGPIEQ